MADIDNSSGGGKRYDKAPQKSLSMVDRLRRANTE